MALRLRELAVERLDIRPFTVSVDARSPVDVPGLRPEGSAQGWLVGAVANGRAGWWGPVQRHVAAEAAGLFAAIPDRHPTSAPGWGERVRTTRRHAHTGLLGVAAGAIELACWDLAGVLEDRPVWALLVDEPACDRVPCYATCFGLDAAMPDGVATSRALMDGWIAQKWKAPPWPSGGAAEVAVHLAPILRNGIAIDFGGRVAPSQVRDLCARSDTPLTWVEEPYAPHLLHCAVPGEFGVPHAAGEHLYSPAETAILEQAGVDIWQPDAVFCGGFAHLLEVGEAAAGRVDLMPHGGGFLPALHLAAVGIPLRAVEYHLSLEPRRQAHLASPVLAGPGGAPVPTEPGWAGPLRRGVG